MAVNRSSLTDLFYVGYHFFLVLVIIVHYAFYVNTILIIWCVDEDEDEGETYCHMDRDKGSYSVMKYDTTKCICTYVQEYTHTYVQT